MTIIKNLFEYQQYLETIKRIDLHQQIVSSFTFFRGQSNSEWTLSPRLYREGLFEYEGLLITELLHFCPSEFGDNKFQTLTKMQHYGLPTRLLDVTTNPLVALYFACNGINEANKDGVVYIFPNLPVSWSSDALVDFIVDYIFELCGPKRVCLNDMVEKCKSKYSNFSDRYTLSTISSILYDLTIPVLSVMPLKNNNRIINQEGAFFIFGMNNANEEVGKNNKKYIDFSPFKADSIKDIWHNSDQLIIPAESKATILKQLDIYGINENKLFPDLEHQTNYVVNTIKKQYNIHS